MKTIQHARVEVKLCDSKAWFSYQEPIKYFICLFLAVCRHGL